MVVNTKRLILINPLICSKCMAVNGRYVQINCEFVSLFASKHQNTVQILYCIFFVFETKQTLYNCFITLGVMLLYNKYKLVFEQNDFDAFRD